MTTWIGWEADFLSAVSLPNTASNRRFLDSWAANAQHPSLRDNPVDLHLREPGSTDGPTGPDPGQHFQNYTTTTWARTAFEGQLTSGRYPHLLAALRSGNPYGVKNFYDVEQDLNFWGSVDFGAVYVNDVRTGPPVKLKAPQATKGWRDLQHTVSVDMPKALKRSQTARTRALRRLQGGRKVGG